MIRFTSPFLCALFLAGCTSLSARLPDIAEGALKNEQALQENQAFQEMLRLQDRLYRVAHPIMRENADLCKKTAPSIGARSHTVRSYDKRLRPAAVRELRAEDKPTLLYIRPDSPAEKAGLRFGDRLQGPDDKPLSIPGKKLAEYLEDGTELTIVRGNEKLPVTFNSVTECDYPVNLKMTSTINAYATGRSIIMTSGMMNFTQSDDELAAILGHELAHNELSHIRKIITNVILSGFATRYTRAFESESDYVGLYYAARAGYAIERVEDMWRRLGKMNMKYIARDKTHPRFPDRYVRLAAARAEIKAKQEAGEPLEPYYKDKS